MGDLEVRLREELASAGARIGVPGGLFDAGRRRQQRRARRRRVVGAVAALALAGVAVAGMRGLFPTSTDEVATRVDTPSTARELAPGVSAIPGDGEPVPLRLLAVQPNGPSFAIIDLEGRTIARYGPGAHHLSRDAVSGAILTPRGDAVVWSQTTLQVLPGADFSTPPIELPAPEGPSVPGIATELMVVPSPDGTRLWVIRPAIVDEVLAPEGPLPAVIELVEIDTAAVLFDTVLDQVITPVGATDDALIFNAGPQAQALTVDGNVEHVSDGEAIAAHDQTVAILQSTGTAQLFDLVDGGTTLVDQPDPGTWGTTGGPSIPTVAPPLPTVSTRGELLMAIGHAPFDANGAAASSTLVAISMADGTTRTLATFDGAAPVATWSRDGGYVVLAWGDQISVLDASAPEQPVPVATLPEEHFVLAAG